jgi:thioredoxin-related protein
MRPVLFALFTLAFAAEAPAQTPPAPDWLGTMYVNTTYDHRRDAGADLREAMARARNSNRNILLEVGGDWCSWCLVLDRFIDSHPAVRAELARSFVIVKVNFEEERPNRAFLSAFPTVSGYPAFIVLDPAGKFLAMQDTGELERNRSYDKVRVTTFARRWRRP